MGRGDIELNLKASRGLIRREEGEIGMGRRSGSCGGMQTASIAQASIICPKCGKPAFSAIIGSEETYKHFTKAGAVAHIKDTNGNWSTKRI